MNQIYNKMPLDITQEPSINKFKNVLKIYQAGYKIFKEMYPGQLHF